MSYSKGKCMASLKIHSSQDSKLIILIIIGVLLTNLYLHTHLQHHLHQNYIIIKIYSYWWVTPVSHLAKQIVPCQQSVIAHAIFFTLGEQTFTQSASPKRWTDLFHMFTKNCNLWPNLFEKGRLEFFSVFVTTARGAGNRTNMICDFTNSEILHNSSRLVWIVEAIPWTFSQFLTSFL